jgi:membrane protease YdiL (CAAX protease family)
MGPASSPGLSLHQIVATYGSLLGGWRTVGWRRRGGPHWGDSRDRIDQANIARHPAGAFVVFFYVTGWIFFLPPLLGQSGFGLLPYDLPPQPSILALTLVALAGGAFLVTRIDDGKDGVRELRSRYFSWRTGPQWYLLALFGAPLLLLVGAAAVQGARILGTFGATLPQFLPSYVLQVVLIAVLISLWEETGWMAFLSARWQKRFGPVIASLMVAPLFGLGHFPLLFLAGGLTDSGRLTASKLPEYVFYLLVLFAVPVRVVLTWVFNSTGGSLPLVAVLHVSIDVVGSAAILTGFYPGVDGRLMYFGLAIVAIGVLVMTRGRLGYRGTVAGAIPAANPAPAAVPLS